MNKLNSSQKGMTLIEVLVTLLISAIVMTVIYSIFTTGASLFQKIKIEGLLRDDADFVVTSLMNELYENSPKSVREYSTNTETGIEIIRAAEKKITENGKVVDDPQNAASIKMYFKKDATNKEYRNLFIEKNNKPYKIGTSDTIITKGSSISLDNIGHFNNNVATSGTIELKLHLLPKEWTTFQKQPLELISTFGF